MKRGSIKSQRGLTLIEMLVYVALSGIAIGILSLALKNANLGFLSHSRSVRMHQGAREALSLMAREIGSAGLKRCMYQDGAGHWMEGWEPQAALLPGDSSSFSFTDGGRYDAITVRTARLDAAGAPQGVDTISYQVDAGQEMLQRQVNGGRFEDFCAGIDALQMQYGVFAVQATLASEAAPDAAHWSSSGAVTLANAPNRLALTLAGAGTGLARLETASFAVTGDRTYALDFAGSGDDCFFAAGGVMEAVLLDGSGAVLKAEPFLPGRTLENRHIEFQPPSAGGCRVALRLTAGGPAGVRLASLRFGQADMGAFLWRDAPTLAEKKAVRAVRLMIMAKAQGNASVTGAASSYTLGNAVVQYNDRLERRNYSEQVAIPNNGLF